VEVKAGNSHTCARRQGGDVLCWGDNLHNQVLGKAPTAYLRPTAVKGLPP
jgi:alpha-tubulin suppressor-like RCC1 family protein